MLFAAAVVCWLTAALAAQGVPPGAPVAPPSAPAQEGAPGEAPAAAVAKIPVRIVNGRLVVACQLSAIKRFPVNLFVDLESPVGLLLHNKAAAGIGAEEDDGTPNPITVHLPDLNVEVAQREVGDEGPYDRFTKWYSKELGESAVVGTLGARVLARYHLALDLESGFLELSAPRAKDGERPGGSREAAGDAAGEGFAVPVTLFNDVAWVRVGFGNQRSGALGLGTARYDTRIDADLADELGHPAGDVGPVTLGDVDLAREVAFRPERVQHVHPEGVFGLTGLGLLRHFRVELDRVNLVARFRRTAPPNFPEADLAFFRARASEAPEPMQAWLGAHLGERLAPEAAEWLLDLWLDRGADDPTIEQAMVWVQKTRPPDLIATGALELMGKMFQRGRPAYALAAGALGLDGGRADRYPDAIHKIHARMGSVHLERGEREPAWKHLLSAAFGLPDDGPLNLDLARYYELEGRAGRAFSRYLQALLAAESGPQALEAIQRLLPKIADAEAFSVDAIEKRIEGKIEGFGVASKWKPAAGAPPPTRAVLSELYTNAHSPGQIGIALASDGLRDHFGKERLVQVVYHVPAPEMEPLANPLAVYCWDLRARGAMRHVIDGVADAPAGALAIFKQRVFDACEEAVAGRLQVPAAHTIAIEARATRERIQGTVVVRGPEAADAAVQILLVERGVLFPGKSRVVIQRNVARAALTADADGEPYEPREGAMEVPFDRAFSSVVAENTAWLEEQAKNGAALVPLTPARIDPRQARVVAILRSVVTGEVLQAGQADPELPEDLR